MYADKNEKMLFFILAFPHCNPSRFACAAQIFRFRKDGKKMGGRKMVVSAGITSFFCPPFFCQFLLVPVEGQAKLSAILDHLCYPDGKRTLIITDYHYLPDCTLPPSCAISVY
jgi:hypothetical protein